MPASGTVLGVQISARIVPLVLLQLYLTATLVAFAFGPLDFQVPNRGWVILYALLGQASIAFGYLAAMGVRPHGFRSTYSAIGILKLSVVATAILLPATITMHNYGRMGIAEAITDPGAAYHARAENFDGYSKHRFLTITRAFMSPILALHIPLGIVLWSRMSTAWRMVWMGGGVGIIIKSLLSGAAIGIFDVVLTAPWLIWLAFRAQSREGSLQSRRSLPFKKVMALVLSAALIGSGVYYFSYSRQSRYGMVGNEYPAWTTGWSKDMYGVQIPEFAEYSVYMLTNYVGQGYVGLGECLELPFEWCFGTGHSVLLMRYAGGSFFGDPTELILKSYPGRLYSATGYDYENNWHTIYPWLASDVTFFGAFFIVGLFAYLLSLAWNDALIGANPFAFGFLAQILILFFYVPANSGRLSYPEEMFAFWGLLILWWSTRCPIRMKRAAAGRPTPLSLKAQSA